MYENYIDLKDDKYIIKRIFNNKEYQFAVCDTLDETKLKIEELDKDGWPIPSNQIVNETKLEHEDYLNPDNYYLFDIKVGKAYKHKFLVLTRYQTYELLPKMDYEDGCEIILDDIKANVKLNFVPRIVIRGDNEELLTYLEELSKIDPNQRKYVKLLKKENINPSKKFDDIIKENTELKQENTELNDKINIIKNILNEIYEFIK